MKRHESIIPLSHDHHHGLILAQLLKPGAPEYKGLPNDSDGKSEYAINAWQTELKVHFRNEEEILFPSVKERNDKLDQLIKEILEEHKALETLFTELELKKGNEKILNEIGYKLEAHIRKEEREVFNLIQQIIPEDELNKLNGMIQPVKEDDSKSCG